MKKGILVFLCWGLLIIVFLNGCKKTGINKATVTPIEPPVKFDLPWKGLEVKASMPLYTVKSNLSNVEGIELISNNSEIHKEQLAKYMFLIKKPDIMFEQPFNIYEKNREDGIPNLITSDSIIHVYNLIYDRAIESIEKERLAEEVKSFTESAFKKSLDIYNGTREKQARKAALSNVAYFGVAIKLLELNLPGGVPIEANRMIDNDIKRIRGRWSNGSSEIFPYYIDYNNYIVRGHYSRDTDLKKYFLTMMWYSNTPFYFEYHDKEINDIKRMDHQIGMAIIMTSQILGDKYLRDKWEDIYNISSMYMGRSNELNIYDLSSIIKEVYGEKVDFNKIYNKDKIKRVYELAKEKFYTPSRETISSMIVSSTYAENSTQFRLMGQMVDICEDIYNDIMCKKDNKLYRPFPKGIDIPAAFGEETSYKILNENIYDTENIEKIRSMLSVDKPGDYFFNNSILWITKGFSNVDLNGYPSFMQNNKWGLKKLLTYVSSISDSKHLTNLNSKALENKEDKVNYINKSSLPGYVEPYVTVYERLEYVSSLLSKFLIQNGFKDIGIQRMIDNFTNTANFLKTVSIKELNSSPLTKEEEDRIREWAKELKNLTMEAVESKADEVKWEGVPKVDRNMAGVSDFFCYDNQTLQTAIGSPYYIYAIVPKKDGFYITRGSVYTYYEFIVSKKISDSEWQSILKNEKKLEIEPWIQEIVK